MNSLSAGKISREQAKHRAADRELGASNIMKKHPLIVCFMLAILALATQGSAQQKIAVSYPGIAGYNIPFWVTLDTGEFKKAGLEVDPVLISGGSKSMQALLSGGMDFAHVSGGVSVQASLSVADVVIIGTGSNSMSAVVIAVKEIKSYQDLKGKIVGIASFGGNNYIGFYQFDHATEPAPQLVLTYGPVPKLQRVVSAGGRW